MENDKFFNYYVEILTSTLHDALGKNLVFQTQAKIAKEELDIKNKTIESLSSKLEEYSNIEENSEKVVREKSDELNNKLQEINNLIRERDIAKSEASHLEVFRNELISAKQSLQNKEEELQKLKEERDIAKSEVSRLESFRNELISVKEALENKEEEVKYLKMTPAQKRKYNSSKQITDNTPNINILKDGGNF